MDISEEKKMDYAGLYVLDLMENEDYIFPLHLSQAEKELAPILEHLLIKDLVKLVRSDEDCNDEGAEIYQITEKGQDHLFSFLDKFENLHSQLELFSAVDLETSEFAYASYYDFENDEQWEEYLYDERFQDLRVALAEYLKLDSMEVMFYSYWIEGRYGLTVEDDEGIFLSERLLGSVWEEIEQYCIDSIHFEELDYREGEHLVPARVVMEELTHLAGLAQKEIDDIEGNISFDPEENKDHQFHADKIITQ